MMNHLINVIVEKVDLANQELHLATVATERYLFPLHKAGTFKASSLKKMIAYYLNGINYVGMIEPSYYPYAVHAQASHKGVVHWHAHLVVWGDNRANLNKVAMQVGQKHQSFIPGCPAFHSKPMRHESVLKAMCYALKSPRNRYAFYIPDIIKVNRITGEIIDVYRQRKQLLRPGEMAKLALVMQDQYLDGLMLGGGGGADVAKEVKRLALSQ